MIAVPKSGSRAAGKAATLVAAAVYLSITRIVPAWADYEHAKIHFDSLDADSRFQIGLGLIGTGDFKELLDFGFTRQFYDAVIEFQIREGFAPDGELDSAEFDRLKNRSAEFYDSLGLRYYDHPDAASRLLVPRLAFDSETRTPRGLAFERHDKSLSLSFVAYSAEEKTFSQLYDSMTKTTEQRKVVYKKRRDRYFVSSGFYRGRHYYTWIRAIEGGSTGFILSWTSPLNNMGSRISIVLSNLFVSGDISDVPVPSPSQMAPEAQKEVPNPDSGGASVDAGAASVDAGAASVDSGAASVDGGAASVDGGTASVDGGTASVDGGTASGDLDADVPSEYWPHPTRSRTVEIKGYDFVFTPTGRGKTGTIKGASFLTQSHIGKYEVLRNDPDEFTIRVNIGNDEPTHTNAIDGKIDIQGANATLTGTLRRENVGQLTETIQGDGSENRPFLIKFAKGSLKWHQPTQP
jgi:hypothetical protein